ncbi:hypothetical protein ACVWZB_004762 [Paenibacillus polymyxa]
MRFKPLIAPLFLFIRAHGQLTGGSQKIQPASNVATISRVLVTSPTVLKKTVGSFPMIE